MKRLLPGLALSLLLLLPLAGDGRIHLVVAANQAPPYRTLTDGSWGGFYFAVFDLLAQRLGITYQVVEAPVARALDLLRDGTADLMLGPLRTGEREAFMLFTAASFPAERKVFYVKPGQPDIRVWADLRGLTISILKGGSYSERFDGDKSLLKDEISDYQSAVRKVANDRSDAVVMPELQGDTLLRGMGLKLAKCSLFLEGTPSHIAFSRLSKNLAIVPALEKAMERLYADGSIDRLLTAYR